MSLITTLPSSSSSSSSSSSCLSKNLQYNQKIHIPNVQPRSMSFHRRTLNTSISACVRQDTTVWTQAPLTALTKAAEDLYNITINVSDSPHLISSYTKPGQYLQVKLPEIEKPSFLAIASSPSSSSSNGEFQFLVKSIEGSIAQLLCGLKQGDVVELSSVMGKGFDVSRISPPEKFPSVFIFATGSGISPVRSLIESGFPANKRPDVWLYYGARNLQRMAYQERFKEWEAFGVNVVPVLSQPEDRWDGERGYVQAAFARAKHIFNPLSTGSVLCGQKQMAEEITSLLVAEGVSTEKILKNF